MGTSQSCFFGAERILELVFIILSLMSSVVTDIEEFHFNHVVELISLKRVQPSVRPLDGVQRVKSKVKGPKLRGQLAIIQGSPTWSQVPILRKENAQACY